MRPQPSIAAPEICFPVYPLSTGYNKHILPKIIHPTYQYKYITVFLFMLLVIVSKSIEHVFLLELKWFQIVKKCNGLPMKTVY